MCIRTTCETIACIVWYLSFSSFELLSDCAELGQKHSPWNELNNQKFFEKLDTNADGYVSCQASPSAAHS